MNTQVNTASSAQQAMPQQQVQQQPQHQQSSPQARGDRETAMLPRVDVLEDEAGITLLADLPGVPKDQLELRVEGDRLQIEGRVVAAAPERLQPMYAEVRTPRFRREFTLSRELDTSRVEAQLKDGVLQLRIPKHDHAQPRRIQVQVA